MKERICTNGGECLQLCRALDDIGGFGYAPQGEMSCMWPNTLNEIQTEEVSSQPNGKLLQALGVDLEKVLDEHQQAPDQSFIESERGLAAINGVFDKQLAFWKEHARIAAAGRIMTSREAQYYTTEIKLAQQAAVETRDKIGLEAMTIAQARHDRSTLESHGLLFDDKTCSVVDRLVYNIVYGRPTLIVGDKGIAKTNLAKFAAGLFSDGRAAQEISGHGGMMSGELVGKDTLVQGKGTVFKESSLVGNMREGRPLVLDEANLADQQIMMRLQSILLKKPGDVVTIQESDQPDPITVKRGFCVLATANEASARYHAREELDPAFRDRFDIIRVDYPDINTNHITEYPSTNVRLALAHVVTETGKENPHVPANQVVTLARLAHATQRLYTLPARNVASDLVQTSTDYLDDEPLLTECITPRRMLDIITFVAQGIPGVTIKSELQAAIRALDAYGHNNGNYVQAILDNLLKETS